MPRLLLTYAHVKCNVNLDLWMPCSIDEVEEIGARLAPRCPLCKEAMTFEGWISEHLAPRSAL